MPDQYPFVLSNNKIDPLLRRIRSAARPEKLTVELIAQWGFTASNDRALPRVLKVLGFLTESGAPTAYYDRLRDNNDWKFVIAERLKDTYSDLFAMDQNISKAPEADIRGAISRITGKDEETVRRYYNTFKAFASLADFGGTDSTQDKKQQDGSPPPQPPAPTPVQDAPTPPAPSHRKPEYHYNIQIHLPVTTDITVYNAIFKSLRENLGV